EEAGTYEGLVDLQVEDGVASFAVPDDAQSGDTLHLILEATDDGVPALTQYQRVVVTVEGPNNEDDPSDGADESAAGGNSDKGEETDEDDKADQPDGEESPGEEETAAKPSVMKPKYTG